VINFNARPQAVEVTPTPPRKFPSVTLVVVRRARSTKFIASVATVRYAARRTTFGLIGVAAEDCRHLSRRLERDLLTSGDRIVRVPPKLMAHIHDSARTYGKSDPIDALAVARAALREPNLPTARSLDRASAYDTITTHLIGHEDTVARLARRLVERLRDLTTEIDDLEAEITTLIQAMAPTLLAVVGVGPLTAAKILGETAGIDRFTSKDAYARFNGTAPLPVWSSNKARHRLSRTGNRQLNAALHRMAMTQMRCHPGAKAMIQRRRAAGDGRHGSTTHPPTPTLRRRLHSVTNRPRYHQPNRRPSTRRLTEEQRTHAPWRTCSGQSLTRSGVPSSTS